MTSVKPIRSCNMLPFLRGVSHITEPGPFQLGLNQSSGALGDLDYGSCLASVDASVSFKSTPLTQS